LPGYGKDQQGRDLPFGFLVPLVWRKQLGCLRGKSGQLHFELVEADLFAVTFGG